MFGKAQTKAQLAEQASIARCDLSHSALCRMYLSACRRKGHSFVRNESEALTPRRGVGAFRPVAEEINRLCLLYSFVANN